MFRNVVDSSERTNYRTQNLWLLLLICWTTLALSACTSGRSRWLQGIPCRAPCWEGITPGQSSASETVELLNHNWLVANVQKKTYPYTPELGGVSWNWADAQEGGVAYYSISNSSQIINMIAPIFWTPFQLRDVMATYGDPSHIVAIAQQPPDATTYSYDLWFIFLPQGLALRNGRPQKPDLGENMLIYQVIFFVPTLEGLEASIWITKEHPDWVIPWEGFKGFDYYCRDAVNGRACRGK